MKISDLRNKKKPRNFSLSTNLEFQWFEIINSHFMKKREQNASEQ